MNEREGMKKLNREVDYKFLETLVDIVFLAGARNFSSGDSRADIGTMIAWADEFETKNAGREWTGARDNDYMIEIEKFAFKKLNDSGACQRYFFCRSEEGNETCLVSAVTEAQAQERAHILMDVPSIKETIEVSSEHLELVRKFVNLVDL